MSKRIGFKGIMMLLGLAIVLEVLLIVVYPAMNTHEDALTIAGIETWGDGLYHIRTDDMTLNVSGYYYDDLLVGHTYRIKWVNGIRVDRILRFEELS